MFLFLITVTFQGGREGKKEGRMERVWGRERERDYIISFPVVLMNKQIFPRGTAGIHLYTSKKSYYKKILFYICSVFLNQVTIFYSWNIYVTSGIILFRWSFMVGSNDLQILFPMYIKNFERYSLQNILVAFVCL